MSHGRCLLGEQTEPPYSMVTCLCWLLWRENWCRSHSTRQSPAKGCKQPVLFQACSATLCDFHSRLQAGPLLRELSLAPLDVVMRDIISQSYFFAKKSSSSGLPYALFVRHNFFSHPNQPPVVSYPPRSQSIRCCIWSCERKMRYHTAYKKETRSLTS